MQSNISHLGHLRHSFFSYNEMPYAEFFVALEIAGHNELVDSVKLDGEDLADIP